MQSSDMTSTFCGYAHQTPGGLVGSLLRDLNFLSPIRLDYGQASPSARRLQTGQMNPAPADTLHTPSILAADTKKKVLRASVCILWEGWRWLAYGVISSGVKRMKIVVKEKKCVSVAGVVSTRATDTGGVPGLLSTSFTPSSIQQDPTSGSTQPPGGSSENLQSAPHE
ncbi:hypothetical protein BD779DRAFT_1729495 [Infundibulicybe gibba]|nr:hypothetical protein BD779DRAFT_1729495 [Infundibulicybe gibba]